MAGIIERAKTELKADFLMVVRVDLRGGGETSISPRQRSSMIATDPPVNESWNRWPWQMGEVEALTLAYGGDIRGFLYEPVLCKGAIMCH